jgi:hypothetical protein
MATLKNGLADLNAEGLISKSVFVEGKMADNADFPDPTPSLATVALAREALVEANAAARDGGRSAFLAKHLAMEHLYGLLRDLSGYVVSVAGGSEKVIVGSGFDVRKRSEPAMPPATPGDVVARFTAYPGVVDVSWKFDDAARLAQVFMNADDPADESKWVSVGTTTKSRFRVTGLVTGKFYWFRVQSTGVAGPSPMSDVAKSLAA